MHNKYRLSIDYRFYHVFARIAPDQRANNFPNISKTEATVLQIQWGIQPGWSHDAPINQYRLSVKSRFGDQNTLKLVMDMSMWYQIVTYLAGNQGKITST